MSGNHRTHENGGAADAKVQKTRQALLDSLIGLVRDKRYDQIDVGDIVGDAEVGRSTFYDHYRGKDDMLVETMGHMLDVMAAVAGPSDVAPQLEAVLRHFQENRRFAQHLFSSPSARPVMERITRALALRIEARLDARAGAEPAIPARWLAAQLAESQFVVIRAWLGDDGARTPSQVARALRDSAAATIAALR